MNIRSLSAHHDELLVLLGGLRFTFDIIGLSETKEQCEKGFLSNINLAGCSIHSQPRLQLHGAIYRPDSFVMMLRYCANLKAIWINEFE